MILDAKSKSLKIESAKLSVHVGETLSTDPKKHWHSKLKKGGDVGDLRAAMQGTVMKLPGQIVVKQLEAVKGIIVEIDAMREAFSSASPKPAQEKIIGDAKALAQRVDAADFEKDALKGLEDYSESAAGLRSYCAQLMAELQPDPEKPATLPIHPLIIEALVKGRDEV